METNLENKVFDIISENLGIVKDKISLDSKLEDLCEDSISLFQLVIAFEREFDRQVEYESLMQIITVQDILDYINKETAAK